MSFSLCVWFTILFWWLLSQAETVIDLKPFDAKLMIPIDTSPVSLVLEGSHLGRGSRW